MAAGKDGICAHRPYGLLEQGSFRPESDIGGRGYFTIRIHVECSPTGTVSDKKVSPFIEADAVWIWKIIYHKGEIESARVETIQTRCTRLFTSSIGGFYIFQNKDTALVIDIAIRPIYEIIGRVMGVVRSYPPKDPFFIVRHPVSIGIF